MKLLALALLLAISCASTAHAALSTSHLTSDAAAAALIETSGGGYRFAAELLQWDKVNGKLALRQRPVRAPGDPAVEIELRDLPNGVASPFTLTFDGASRATMSVTSRAKKYVVANLPAFAIPRDFNELFVRTEAVLRGGRVTVSGLVLNGVAISDTSSALDGESGALDILRIRGGSLATGFVLSGSITMKWTGNSRSERDRLGVQIWGARVAAADTAPPVVAITAPSSGSFVTTPRPTLTASYSDAGSGVDLASLRLLLDGVDRTADAQVTGSGLSFTPSAALAEGAHRAELRVRDAAGNEGRAALDFVVDTVGPALAFTSPEGIFVLGDATPALAVVYSDASSGVDLASLEIRLDGVAVSGCLVGAGNAHCEAPVLAAGSHLVTAALRDRAGHTATSALAFQLELDLHPPSLAVTSPDEGAVVNTPQILVRGTVADDGQVAGVTINGVAATLDDGRFQALLPLAEGLNLLTLTAIDATGKSRDALLSVTLDTSAPRIVVEMPGPGQLTNQTAIRVTGQVSDGGGAVALTLQGEDVPLAENRFEVTAPLEPGLNALVLRASDRAGNQGTTTLPITRFDLPEVAITSPVDLSFLATTAVDVSGTVSEAGSTVSVNGTAAVVSGTAFLARDVPLLEGGNILTATVSNGSGRMATDSINVVRDLTPPRLAITYPEAGAMLFEPVVDVAGMVNDIVAGTVNAAEARVTVNGRTATVVNRSFLVRGVPLALGDSLLQVAAVDAGGNRGEIELTLHRAEPNGPRLAVAAGNHQEAPIGALLPLPLAVRLVTATDQPVAGKPILFQVRGNNGSLEGGKRRLVVLTDAAGRASVRFTLGTRAAAGAAVVEASSPGVEGRVAFFATSRPEAAAHLVVDSGDQQVGIAGRELPRPLVAVVTDAGHNRLEGAAVRLTVVKGEGRFANGLREILDLSDSDGRVIVPWTLDPEEGIANNVVEARIEGVDPGPVAAFVASGRSAGDPAETSISGVVLDNSNLPVAGVTLRILDSPITAHTDERGLFRIQGAPVGSVQLIVDGSTAERPGSWPTLEFVLSTIPGRDNTVNMPIFLLPLDQRTGLIVDETRGGTLTLPEVPGFALEIAPGSVTFPSGSRSGVIGVTVVHNDKVPMVPNFGQQPRFIVTIQPAGARFEPPARLTLPNLEGLAPGEVTEMYSFDHDLGHFVSIGPATVSEDGAAIVANPGVGVIKAGWHCGGNPSQVGTAHQCPECTGCFLATCTPALREGWSCQGNPDQEPCTVNKRCKSGKCVGEPVKVTSLTGPCVAEKGSSVTFEAGSNAERGLDWFTPGGTPPTGQGSTHTVTYSSNGLFVVQAGCKEPSAGKTISIGESCASITTVTNIGIVRQRPPLGAWGQATPFIKPIAQGCVEGAQWCFTLSDLGANYYYEIEGGSAIDIVGADDPDVTPATCQSIISDFTPPTGSNVRDGPPRTAYWSREITVKHEAVHVERLQTVFFPGLLRLLLDAVGDPTRCTECKSAIPRNLASELSGIFEAYDADYQIDEERIAHAVTNPLYLQLIEGIRARARAARGSQSPWPAECE